MTEQESNLRNEKIKELREFIKLRRRDVFNLASFYNGKQLTPQDPSEYKNIEAYNAVKNYKRTREDDARFLPSITNVVNQIEEAQDYLDNLIKEKKLEVANG